MDDLMLVRLIQDKMQTEFVDSVENREETTETFVCRMNEIADEFTHRFGPKYTFKFTNEGSFQIIKHIDSVRSIDVRVEIKP